MPHDTLFDYIHMGLFCTEIFRGYDDLKGLFPTEDYIRVCKKSKKMMWIYKEHNGVSFLIKLLYSVFWFMADMFCIMFLVCYRIVPLNACGVVTMALLVFSLVLNFFSYYAGVEFTFFLRRISLIEKLDYNDLLPSSTYGFKFLSRGAAVISSFFFLVSFLYTVGLMELILAKSDFSVRGHRLSVLSGIKYSQSDFAGMLILFCTQGFLTTVLIAFFNRYFLERILWTWKMESLAVHQERLENLDADEYTSEDQGIVKNISQDKIGYSFFEVMAGVLALLADAVALFGMLPR